MPFTLSHAVLAPPLAKLSGQRLPIAALAIGTMLPDLHRLFTLRHDPTPHLWSALLYPNLLLGLVFCALWYLLYRPALYRFVGVHHPLNLNTIKSVLGFVCGLILALLIGNATHLIWDGLTHHDFRSFAFQDFLAQSVQLGTGIYPMHRILQIGSSILALPFLLWMSLHYYRKHRQVSSVSNKNSRLCHWSYSFLSIVCGGFFTLGLCALYSRCDLASRTVLFYGTCHQ